MLIRLFVILFTVNSSWPNKILIHKYFTPFTLKSAFSFRLKKYYFLYFVDFLFFFKKKKDFYKNPIVASKITSHRCHFINCLLIKIKMKHKVYLSDLNVFSKINWVRRFTPYSFGNCFTRMVWKICILLSDSIHAIEFKTYIVFDSDKFVSIFQSAPYEWIKKKKKWKHLVNVYFLAKIIIRGTPVVFYGYVLAFKTKMFGSKNVNGQWL